jgi:hypothetical protein
MNGVPGYAPYTQLENGITVTTYGLIEWNVTDRDKRNDATRQVAYLRKSHGAYRISLIGPASIRDVSLSRLAKARAWGNEAHDVWTGAIADGVTLGDALVRFRALRTAMQEDADAYRSGQ